MEHIYTIFVSIIFFEIFRILKLKNIFSEYLILIKKILKSLKSKNISDHWLQKFLISISLKLLKLSLKVLMIIISLITIIYFLNYINNDLFNLLISINGFLLITLTIIIYSLLKRLINAKL